MQYDKSIKIGAKPSVKPSVAYIMCRRFLGFNTRVWQRRARMWPTLLILVKLMKVKQYHFCKDWIKICFFHTGGMLFFTIISSTSRLDQIVDYQSTRPKQEIWAKLTKRAKAYSSSCSQVILVYLHSFRRNSLFCSQKSPKNHAKSIFLGFKVIQSYRCWPS